MSLTGLSLALALGLTAWGCGGAPGEARSGEDDPPRRYILLYDRSTSILDHELAHYRELTATLLRDELRHGDRVVAMEILQLSLDEPPKRWAQNVPHREFPGRAAPRDSVVLARFATDVRDYLRSFTDPEGREVMLGTDILSTLQDAGEEIRAVPGYRTVLVLFSDMLQATREINMEGLIRMPPPDWISRAHAEGRLPDFTGVCVLVAGARVDTPAAQRVRAFWMEYFQTTGATLLDRNYSFRPPRLSPESCPGM